ncbi:MAG TPA: ABC transporter permease [Candidatus Acidoferrales bacterium]|nr:ABC transporter permease [Candidatus Acidoferrales bacterium]
MSILRRITNLFHRSKLDQEIEAELRSHIEMRAADNIAAGMPPQEARRQAVLRFGSRPAMKERVIAADVQMFLDSLWQDLCYGLRLLRKSPSFTAIAVLTLALGIGATTTMFSVVESVLWRPMPFPQSQLLVTVESANRKQPENYGAVSVADYLDWRAQNRVFDGLAAFDWSDGRTLTGDGGAERVYVMPVSANFFETLRVSPSIGRTFRADEEEMGKNRVALLSHSLWESWFHADGGVVGNTISLDGQPYTVVGVCPASLRLEFDPDAAVYVPLTLDAASSTRAERALRVFGRLKEGMDVRRARTAITLIAQRLAQEHPKEDGDWGVRIQSLRDAFTHFETATTFSYFFLGAVSLILLIACATVANLQLSRGLGRQREFAVREALGASRRVLTRQLLTESFLVALAAGLAGTLFAFWGTSGFSAFLPPGTLPRQQYISFDGMALFFSLGLSLVTALLFGLAPAIFSSRVDLNSCLKEANRTGAGGTDQKRLRNAFVIGQTAIAFILLFGAGLFVNSFLRLERISLGFRPHNILTMQIHADGPQYSSPDKVILFYETMLRQVRALPGIRAAEAASQVPLTSGMDVPFAVAGQPRPAPGEAPGAVVRVVTTAYFQLMSIPVLAGRNFTTQDTATAPHVVIVNQNFTRHFLAGENPIGKELQILPGSYDKAVVLGPVQIVGVVGNVKEVGLNEVGFNDIYFPFAQSPDSSMYLAVSTNIPGVVDPIRKEVASLDKNLPLLNVMFMDQRVADAFRGDRFNVLLIGSFAIMAVLLASIGIFGVASYSVGRRTQEFGIRMALGADRKSILGLTLRSAAALSLTGLLVGFVAALALGRILGNRLYIVPREHEGLLYGVSLFDPLTLAAALVLLTSIALVASYIPARRATKVDPMVALRHE